ncbi:unnamed protein product [Trifolium pratense]|uniref:Uncharacterized protein n=1 Tax=Trifolium pratense TaxID=57577 RepID=A0ACB0L031_TRIPR|nr:unnamed protein product [Trifolium pratense]
MAVICNSDSIFSLLFVGSIHPPPAFGSSPNLEALALEENDSGDLEEERSVDAIVQYTRPMHEITFSTDDKPKLLSQFVGMDTYWNKKNEKLKETLEKEVLKIET